MALSPPESHCRPHQGRDISYAITQPSQGSALQSKGTQSSNKSDPQLVLLGTMVNKVFSIIMLELEPNTPLSSYNLDSFVSVELRNWIRRVTGVELQFPNIVNTVNFWALARPILSHRKVSLKRI